jgi:hypothetical protein
VSEAKESTITVAARGMVANKPPSVTPRLTRSTAPRNITKTPPARVNNKGGKRNAKGAEEKATVAG